MAWAAVVLAGGGGRRLGGVDKPALTVSGRTLLDGVLAACADAAPLVVVGPRRPTTVPVRWTCEHPPGGGPLAALAAGLAEVPTDVEELAVLAADLPGLRTDTLTRLRAALAVVSDGAVLLDGDGRRQWLCGVWRAGVLRAAVAAVGDPAGRSVRSVLGPLEPVGVSAEAGEAADVDTPEDLRAARGG